MNRDEVFKKKFDTIPEFTFNAEVAQVFDDMVNRSIPFYQEIHKLIIDLTERNIASGDYIYDLGCSTATTICVLDNHLKHKGINAQFVGIDNSSHMLKKAEEKLLAQKITNATLLNQHLEACSLNCAQIVIMNYTLQFIPPERRPALLKKIYNALNPGGIFILSEKIKSDNHSVNNLLTELYYDFKKRNGYSELEISQKREALENVLIPLTPEKQIELLEQAGFTKVENLFRWYNFASFIGIK